MLAEIESIIQKGVCLLFSIPLLIDNLLSCLVINAFHSWILENHVWYPSDALQKHLVLIDINRPEGITIWTRFNHPLQRDVVNARLIDVISSIVIVSRHEANHTLMRAQHGLHGVVVPGQTDGVCGVRVNGKMTYTSTQYTVFLKSVETFLNLLNYVSPMLHLFAQRYNKKYEMLMQFKIEINFLCESTVKCNLWDQTKKQFCGNHYKWSLKRNTWMLLFIKDTLNWSKVTVKPFIMLQKISISNKCCSFEHSIHENNPNHDKCITVSTKTWSSTTVFDIDNNQKCFLSSNSAYYVTLE